MFRFIHTADIHLDSPLRGLETHEDAPVEELRGATRRAFDNLIEQAIEEEVAFILIAGDLYDGDWKDYNTGLYFAGRMGKLAQAGIRVFIVSGNHDAASNTTKAMPLPDNVTIFSSKKPQTVTIDALHVAIHGQGYTTKAMTENLAASYPAADSGYFNIGLLHTSLTGRENHASYAPCSLGDLQSKGYDYWALGHVHQREVVTESPPVIFPGNIQGRHIKETGPKGATLVTVEDGRITEIEFRELAVVRWSIMQIDLTACSTDESVHDTVRAALEQERDKAGDKTVALRLILTGHCPLHSQLLERTSQWTDQFRAIAEAIGDIWLEKVQYKTVREINPEDLIGSDTPIAGLIDSIRSIDLAYEDLVQAIPELSALRAKLPPELLTGDESLWDLSSDTRAELSTEIQEILISRLLHHGGER